MYIALSRNIDYTLYVKYDIYNNKIMTENILMPCNDNNQSENTDYL